MTAKGSWQVAERGTLGALRFVARVYALLGRRAVRVMLLVRPIGPATRVSRREREKAATELARAFVRGLEEVCLRHRYQWFNFYDVWEPEATP